jgi:hypothetical protein
MVAIFCGTPWSCWRSLPVRFLGRASGEADERGFAKTGLPIPRGRRGGVEKLTHDVGQNGSAARGDATADYQDEETREELAEIRAGREFGEFGKELGGKVGGVTLGRREGGAAAQTKMMRTETGLGFQAELTAALAIGETMQATKGLVLPRGIDKSSRFATPS